MNWQYIPNLDLLYTCVHLPLSSYLLFVLTYPTYSFHSPTYLPTFYRHSSIYGAFNQTISYFLGRYLLLSLLLSLLLLSLPLSHTRQIFYILLLQPCLFYFFETSHLHSTVQLPYIQNLEHQKGYLSHLPFPFSDTHKTKDTVPEKIAVGFRGGILVSWSPTCMTCMQTFYL